MAGERTRFGRFVEISAGCVDPDLRGKGYAVVLMTRLAQRLQAQALTPILHVSADNAGATALYEKLGFAKRRTLRITILRAAHVKPSAPISRRLRVAERIGCPAHESHDETTVGRSGPGTLHTHADQGSP
jgi:ribosomal protein S18 acetylase RimI-like enzyme